jgi:hypothetical protein
MQNADAPPGPTGRWFINHLKKQPVALNGKGRKALRW